MKWDEELSARLGECSDFQRLELLIVPVTFSILFQAPD